MIHGLLCTLDIGDPVAVTKELATVRRELGKLDHGAAPAVVLPAHHHYQRMDQKQETSIYDSSCGQKLEEPASSLEDRRGWHVAKMMN